MTARNMGAEDLPTVEEALRIATEKGLKTHARHLTTARRRLRKEWEAAKLTGPAQPKTCSVRLDQIVMDPDLQMRAEMIDDEFVYQLAETLEDKDHELQPVRLFAGEGKIKEFWLADGFHRVNAYTSARRAFIPAIVEEGGREAALRYSLGANADQNAKPRTRKDLRKAVTAALMRYYFTTDAEEDAEDGADPKNTNFVKSDGGPQKSENVNFTKTDGGPQKSENTQCVKSDAGPQKSKCPKFGKLPKSKRWTMERIAEVCKTTHATVSNIAKDIEKANEVVESKASAPVKLDRDKPEQKFWKIVEGYFSPLEETLKGFEGCHVWLFDEYPIDDRIRAAQGMEETLKQHQTRIRDLREQLQQRKKEAK